MPRKGPARNAEPGASDRLLKPPERKPKPKRRGFFQPNSPSLVIKLNASVLATVASCRQALVIGEPPACPLHLANDGEYAQPGSKSIVRENGKVTSGDSPTRERAERGRQSRRPKSEGRKKAEARNPKVLGAEAWILLTQRRRERRGTQRR